MKYVEHSLTPNSDNIFIGLVIVNKASIYITNSDSLYHDITYIKTFIKKKKIIYSI